MSEDGSFQERILTTLESIIANDQQLKSFTIVPEEENIKNKSPILYEDHNLGLESWCVKHIYRYAYTELIEARSLMRKRKFPPYKAGSINHLLVGALLINPDVTTFWSMKRELVENDILSIESELLFSKLVLSYKSKSNETFSYRRWLLKRTFSKPINTDTLILLYRSELQVATMAAENSPNNYHAWTHRIWCTENIPNSHFNPALYHSELQQSLDFVEKHVSEHTGYHYRQYLFGRLKSLSVPSHYSVYLQKVCEHLGLISDSDSLNLITYLLGQQKTSCKISGDDLGWQNYLTLLLHELFFVIPNLRNMFAEHESLWSHHRFILYQLVSLCYEYYGVPYICNVSLNLNSKAISSSVNIINFSHSFCKDGEIPAKISKSHSLLVRQCRLYVLLVRNEKKLIDENLDLCGTPLKGCLVKRHEKWLKCILGFDF